MARSARLGVGLILACVGALALALVLFSTRGESTESSPSDEAGREDGAEALRAKAIAGGERRGPELELGRADKAAVAGRVLDPAGLPIANAQVCALPSVDQLDGLGPGTPRCARSGDDGRYRIDGLWPVATRVGASPPGVAPVVWRPRDPDELRAWPEGEIVLQPGELREPLDLTLTANGAPVRGVIKDIAGGEIEGARVWSDISTTTSDEHGAFELWLAPGPAEIHAAIAGYAQAKIPAVAPSEGVELFLTPESVLVGRVVDADTQAPLADIEVRAQLDEPSPATRTDAQGRFRLEGLEPGSYTPEAIGEARYGLASGQVHLGFGETSEEIVIPVHALAVLAGTIVIAEPEREPCPAGKLLIAHTDEGWAREATIERRDGRVEIPGLLPGRYRVEVECRGYLARASYPEVVIEASERQELEWEVEAGAAIRGQVVDARGEPLAEVSVWAMPTAEGEATRARQTYARDDSLDDGSFVLAGLRPGSYEVHADGLDTPVAVELEATADLDGVRLVMAAIGSIRGRVVDAAGEPLTNIAIVAQPNGSREPYDTRTDERGQFGFERLPATAIRLTVRPRSTWPYGPPLRKPGTSDDDAQGELVEVIAGDTVEVELVVEQRDASIRGRVVDSGGAPVSDAFVQAARMSEETGANPERDRAAARAFNRGLQPVLTDAEGQFELRGLARSGTFVVVAQRRGGGEASAEGVAPGADIELTLVETGSLGGRIVHADGRAPSRIEISAHDRTTQFSRKQVLFQTDRWLMSEIPAGRYTITAVGDGAMSETEAEIELGPGEVRDDIELELAELLTVSGTIVDIDTRAPIAGVAVYAGTAGFEFHDEDRVTASDGRFVVEHVPHGVIRLNVVPLNRGREGKYDFIWHIVRLAATPTSQDVGEVPLVARRLGPDDKPGDLGFTLQDAEAGAEIEAYRIRVAAVRPGGPGAAAGLASGDQIVSVDGHDVQGALAPRWIPLTRVAPGTSLRFGLADGRELTLVVGPPA